MQKCEINGVKVKIWQWWRTRRGQIVQVFGICPVGLYPIATYSKNGTYINVTADGKWVNNRAEPTDCDLVEHLPTCTGFDWVAPTPAPAPEPVAKPSIDPGHGWRLLDSKELVELGDECFSAGSWVTSWNWKEEPRRQSPYPYRRRVAEFEREFWYGSLWPDCGNCFAYAVRRNQGGPIVYVKRNGSEVPSKCTSSQAPHETWISITQEQAMERLTEVDNYDDDDDDDDDDDYDDDDYDDDDYDDSTDDDSCGSTSNFGNPDYDESGDDHTVHVSIYIENLNIYASNLNGISGSAEPENTAAEIEPTPEPEYRPLEQDEVIEMGDEFRIGSFWRFFDGSVGVPLKESRALYNTTRTKRKPVKTAASSAF